MREVRLLRTTYLRGPNVWTYRPALEVWLDIGALEDSPSNAIPEFNDRLVGLLPGLVEHHCGVGERGGFLQRLEGGTMAGHVLEHVVIELLNLADMPTGFGQTRSTSRRGVYRMVFRARDERVARAALAEGHALLTSVLRREAFDVASATERIRDEIDRSYLGPSTASIVAAATERGIPHLRLNAGNLVQLGHGARQHRIWTAETDRTGAIAEGIACDKELTRSLLAPCGVPVPKGRLVTSADDAWEAAGEIGLPVVVKPVDANHGRGVSLDLSTEIDVKAAFARALAHGGRVFVERCIPGVEHRLLVVGGRVVAAARGEPAWVTGDGKSDVQELVDLQINVDPRRGDGGAHPLARIRCAEDGAIMLDLKRQDLTPESVPAEGMRVLIQRNGNMAIDCTDEVHPEVDRVVALAVRIVGLDVAGVDLVATDVSRPLAEQDGAIVEINAGPGLLTHLKPAVGTPRPVGRAIVDHLFAEGDDGRIPIVGIAGSRATGRIARLVAWILHLGGRQVGLACRDGLFFDRRRVEDGDGTRWEAGSRLLMNRSIEAAVLETSAEAILREGLPYDRCDVGVVHDMDGHDRLGEFDVASPEQMVRVMRTQVDVVRRSGAAVLHAADVRIETLAEFSDGEVVLYALDGAHPALGSHRARGGRVAFVRGGGIVLATGPEEVILAGALALPAGPIESEAATLAAVATAWSCGVEPDVLVTGVATFGSDLDPFSQPPSDVAGPYRFRTYA